MENRVSRTTTTVKPATAGPGAKASAQGRIGGATGLSTGRKSKGNDSQTNQMFVPGGSVRSSLEMQKQQKAVAPVKKDGFFVHKRG